MLDFERAAERDEECKETPVVGEKNQSFFFALTSGDFGHNFFQLN